MEEEKKPRFAVTDRRFSARLRDEAQKAQEKAGEPPSHPEEETLPPPPPDPGAGSRSSARQLAQAPPADFVALVAYLGQNAALHISNIRDPEHGPDHEGLAGYLIDLLGVLEQKTRGNIGAEEDRILRSTLAQLRLMYVEATRS